MPSEVVALTCSACGASLEIGPSLDVFACAYCHATLRVQRSGGTISLEQIAGALDSVRTGVERTAAELALQRIDREIEQLLAGAETSRARHDNLGGALFAGLLLVFGSVAAFQGFIQSSFGVAFFGLLLVVVGILYALTVWGLKTSSQRELAAASERLEKLRASRAKAARAVGV